MSLIPLLIKMETVIEYFRPEIAKKLQTRIKIVCLKKEMEMREYLSNLIEKELKKEGV
jgi:hypothetical protein